MVLATERLPHRNSSSSSVGHTDNTNNGGNGGQPNGPRATVTGSTSSASPHEWTWGSGSAAAGEEAAAEQETVTLLRRAVERKDRAVVDGIVQVRACVCVCGARLDVPMDASVGDWMPGLWRVLMDRSPLYLWGGVQAIKTVMDRSVEADDPPERREGAVSVHRDPPPIHTPFPTSNHPPPPPPPALLATLLKIGDWRLALLEYPTLLDDPSVRAFFELHVRCVCVCFQ